MIDHIINHQIHTMCINEKCTNKFNKENNHNKIGDFQNDVVFLYLSSRIRLRNSRP